MAARLEQLQQDVLDGVTAILQDRERNNDTKVVMIASFTGDYLAIARKVTELERKLSRTFGDDALR